MKSPIHRKISSYFPQKQFQGQFATGSVEPDEGFINHPTPKPKLFIKEILKILSEENDLILDPFIGSGSTAVACKHMNRNFIGFEINDEYVRIANERLNNATNNRNER